MPTHKRAEIKLVSQELLDSHQPTIRSVVAVIGKVVAALPAVEYGALHYKELEVEKTHALKQNHGHFDRKMSLSNRAKVELQWWSDNIHTANRHIDRSKPAIIIDSGASGSGWGATDTKTHIGGRWNYEEQEKARSNQINYLEMVAAYLALKSFCKQLRNIHVRLRIDNMTAVAYLNNMGGVKSMSCNEMAKKIWSWCIQRNIWISAEHLPGVLNIIADFKSRNFSDGTEWQLNTEIFNNICKHFGTPHIDLFASRLNAQLPRYIAWKPDPEAEAVDAFMTDWGDAYFYAFPPFCLISKCLQKIEQEQAKGIMVVPKWPTQPWFPKMLHMLVENPVLLPPGHDLLTQPGTGTVHPLSKQLFLLVCRLSGDPTRVWDYHQELSTFCWAPGDNPHRSSITATYASGSVFAAKGKEIHCVHL